MKDKRGRTLWNGHQVVFKVKAKSNGRVSWEKGEIITVGTKYVHVLAGHKRLRLLPKDVEQLTTA